MTKPKSIIGKKLKEAAYDRFYGRSHNMIERWANKQGKAGNLINSETRKSLRKLFREIFVEILKEEPHRIAGEREEKAKKEPLSRSGETKD